MPERLPWTLEEQLPLRALEALVLLLCGVQWPMLLLVGGLLVAVGMMVHHYERARILYVILCGVGLVGVVAAIVISRLHTRLVFAPILLIGQALAIWRDRPTRLCAEPGCGNPTPVGWKTCLAHRDTARLVGG